MFSKQFSLQQFIQPIFFWTSYYHYHIVYVACHGNKNNKKQQKTRDAMKMNHLLKNRTIEFHIKLLFPYKRWIMNENLVFAWKRK